MDESNNFIMEITVQWKEIGNSKEYWNSSRCLYAYLYPDGEEILYIGKAL